MGGGHVQENAFPDRRGDAPDDRGGRRSAGGAEACRVVIDVGRCVARAERLEGSGVGGVQVGRVEDQAERGGERCSAVQHGGDRNQRHVVQAPPAASRIGHRRTSNPFI